MCVWRRVEQHGVVGVGSRVGVKGRSWVRGVSWLGKQGARILTLQRRHSLETCEQTEEGFFVFVFLLPQFQLYCRFFLPTGDITCRAKPKVGLSVKPIAP